MGTDSQKEAISKLIWENQFIEEQSTSDEEKEPIYGQKVVIVTFGLEELAYKWHISEDSIIYYEMKDDVEIECIQYEGDETLYQRVLDIVK